MASFVNPLASVASFKNQQLADVSNNRLGGQVKPAAVAPSKFGRSADEAMLAGQPDLSGFGTIRDRASRQHDMFLKALQAEQKRRQEELARQAAAAASRQIGGGGGGARGSGAAVGKWGLIPGAAKGLAGLNAAFRKQFGYDIPINRGRRTYEQQARLYALYKAGKGNLAARPGTSKHESGRAIDFGGALQNSRSREHRWLQQNAGAFGFKWTGKNFKQFEPWHWEYVW